MKMLKAKHATTRLIPLSERGDGIGNVIQIMNNVALIIVYNLVVLMLFKWYGYVLWALWLAYAAIEFNQLNQLIWPVVFGAIAFLFYKHRHSYRFPFNVEFKAYGLFFGNTPKSIGKKMHRMYAKDSKFVGEELAVSTNMIKMLVDMGVYDVLDPHTGKANLGGYEVEVIRVPSVLCTIDKDDLGYKQIDVLITAPSDVMNKLDGLTDNMRDIVARYLNRLVSIKSSSHLAGDFLISFSDDERATGFDFGTKKEQTTDLVAPDITDGIVPEQYTTMIELAQSVKDWEVPIMKGTVWNLSKAQHLIVAGKSGSGKTYFVNYLIMMLALHNNSLYLCDPKRSDLSSFDQFVGKDRVATTPDDIVKLTQHVVDVMGERYELMAQKRAETQQFQVDFSAFGLKPVVLVIDEMASLMSEFKSKKDATAFQDLITQITMKGRQAGVELISIMQQANASNISTQARDQFGFRVLLGNSNSQERQMMFGTQEDYPDVPVGTGHGLFVLDGLTVTPQVLNTPRLDEADNALFKTLKAVFDNYTPIE